MPARSPRPLVYIGIGTAAGLFSALFGVGGGIVIVPLLMAFCAFAPKPATATSLAAILFTAVLGTARYAAEGEVQWGEAVAIGLPAVAGVVLGTALQRRVSTEWLTMLFAILMVLVGARLVIG